MNNLTLFLMSAILIGLGATLTFDLWALLLNKSAFKTSPSNFCLLGRWNQHTPEGIFRHSIVGFAPPKSKECPVGWIAHYMIGITFAICFIGWVGISWLRPPTLLPALIFGIITVLAPFLIMQPAFGFGIASSKALNPSGARLRSLINHFVFGFGLYIFGLLLRYLP